MNKSREAARYKRTHGEWPDWFLELTEEEQKIARSFLRRLFKAFLGWFRRKLKS